MTAPLAFDLVLCLLLIGVGLAAVLARDLFAAIVLFIVYGLFVAIGWVRLDAVDVALAEAAIGAGLSGVLLLRAAGLLGQRSEAPAQPPHKRHFGSALPCAAIAAVLALLSLLLPDTIAGLRGPVGENLAATGVGNSVTAVLLDFRGYDTLLETVVLFAALVGVWSLTPDQLWGGRPGLKEHARIDGVLTSFGRLLPPVGLMIGVYLVWIGADAPGGAFQAGTVLASVWMLAIMAGLVDAPPVSRLRLRLAVAVGPLLFLAVASAGLFTGGFLVIPAAQAKTIILAIEAALTLSIAVTLALLVMGRPRRPA
ncbi:hydrogenase subunit MbhD domain-containing protein [Rhodopseudomonas palustris]|uniref:hydrogenase subunit MbhD domain-containing protein n=1 Tax=Rhodopseudomonas palustris TaxID=1076 RepID=UPI002ACEB0D9|nr:hydrogenase subunit MbhD domain-containing protein [Rhodopseudomonas palustris]WQG99787.1 hydrogenase subunit MbhD domain-containing protein [Rhodopseudomonas palustris]